MSSPKTSVVVHKTVSSFNGFVMLALALALLVGCIAAFAAKLVSLGVLCSLGFVFVQVGLMVINPGEARVLQLFGEYVGTVNEAGLRWVNPFNSKVRMSLRVRSFESARLKVNDRDGSPVEVAAIVVWKVVDTAKASFAVDDFERFVQVQSEAGLRNLVMRYPYDSHDDSQAEKGGQKGSHEPSLRSATNEVAESLAHELSQRVQTAGVEIVETRISHLAYAPEIAHAMLQRQQAQAMIAARAKLVEGAVGMVEHALQMLSQKGVVNLDDDRRAHMVSNLLVVLCGHKETSPVVNTGTMHA